MAPRRSNTRQLILDTAETLLQDRGYNGFSYLHIAQHLGIQKAAVHYHFPSKTDLGTALIRRHRERFINYTRNLDQEKADLLSKLEFYFALPAAYLQNGEKVCPLGVLEAEFHSLPEDMRREVRLLDQAMRDWLTELLETGRGQGVFHFEGNAPEKVLMVVSALQGVLQLARASGPYVLPAVIRQLKRDLGVIP